ncbi:MAG: starch-binding protein [Lachnospiraceae bacterium]|nr:starch-binding protein [Lachnospiraceae bacterium]
MIKFTKKALSLAVASFVTMTSIFGSSNFAKAETTTNAAEVAPIAADNSSIQTHLSATFTAPNSWTNVYAYAYYTDSAWNLKEPLGCWPGTKLEKGADNKYSVEFESSIGSARIIYVDCDITGPKQIGDNGNYCYETAERDRLPAEDGDEYTEDGYIVNGDVDFKLITTHFSAPVSWDNVYAYAYYTDSANKIQEPLGYWPGTKLEKGTDDKYDVSILSTSGEAKFIFTNVDESTMPNGVMPKPEANDINGYYYPVKAKEQLPAYDENKDTEDGYKAEEGDNSFTSEIVPTPGPISTLRPTITSTIIPTVTPVVIATVTPSAVPTVTPSAIPIVTPSAVPTVTPSAVPTVTPSAVPTVTPSAIPTVTPVITPTVEPSIIPTVVPSVEPSIIPTVTPTAIPTVTPSIIPTVTPTAIPTVTPGVIIDNPIPNDPVKVSTSTTLKGSISFDKTNKTVGETIKIKVSAKNGKPAYKYTYTVKKGNKKVFSVTNTKSKSVNWIPTKAGTYTVSVKITDAKKKSVTVNKKYKVKSAVIKIKSFKTNKSSSQKVKTKIVLSANATTKKGKASYKFAVKLGNGKIKTIKGFSSKKKITWKPAKKGTYTLYVYVKNGKGITVSKTMTFKIKK